MSSNLIRIRIYRMFFVFTICICSHFYAHAQVTVRDAAICAGEIVYFNNLVTGTLEADEVGWYIGTTKMWSAYLGFTDTPAATTEYTLRYVIGGVTFELYVTVTVYPLPNLVIPSGDVTICSGESVPLIADVTNATSLTEIKWYYGVWQYNNGDAFDPRSLGAHTVTATARNAPQCPTVSKPLHITVNFNPTQATGVPGTATHCTQETVNLNDCIDFLVYDVYSNHDIANSTTGMITWYYDDGSTLVPDPERVLLTSTSFYADISDIMVFYSGSCTPAFKQSPNSSYLHVPINITSPHFLHDYNYYDMCFGDSVYAVFQLVDDTFLNPSPCDTIDGYDILSTHSVVREIKTSATKWTLVFAPFTGLDDMIKVKVKGSIPGLEEDFNLFLRDPKPPNIASGTVCINTPADFSVIVDHCDTIRNVTCPSLSSAIVTSKSDQVWNWHVPELDKTTPFQCAVTYTSKLHNKDITYIINEKLEIWTELPELSVSLLQGDFNFPLPFDNATQNLCLGDSLLFTFSTPHNCDTIISVTWIQGNGKPYKESPHIHSYIIKPTQEGSVPYRAKITYKHPKGVTNLPVEIPYTVSVKQRPRLFINLNPPDTLKYCYPDDNPLDFSVSPMKDLINDNFVDPGTERFIIPQPGGGVNELPSFKPDVTHNYVVKAEYQYLCSEMTSRTDMGEVRIIVNKKDDDPAAYIKPPPSIGFCILAGVTIESENKEGSSLEWLYDGNLVPSFPYFLPEGAHTFTTHIYNACYLSGDPMTYSVGVKVAPLPKVTAMSNTTVCRGTFVTLNTLPNPVGTLTWTDLWGQVVPNPVQIQESSTFVVHATIAACGTAKDTVTVFRMVDAAVQLMLDTSVCKNDYMRLRYEWKEGDIVWNNGHDDLTGENPVVQIIENGTYTATVSNICTNATASLNVTMLSLPFIKVKTDTSICYGESLDLESCVIDAWTGDLQWSPSTAINITEPDIYIATVTTKKCGGAKDTMYVNAYKPLILLPNDSNLPHYNRKDAYNVSFQTLQAEDPISYAMSGTLPPGLTMVNGHISGQPALGPYDYNTHHLQVTATDEHQCRASKEYLLTPEWKAANVILPMGDAGNAVFLPGYNLEVYNRNGLLLHKGVGWDGKWNNAFVPAGTYFYKVMILIDNIPEERMNYVVVMYY